MSIDPHIKGLAEKIIASGKNKRAIIVLKAMLMSGSITTDELLALGYNHPPRAVGDVKDAGIPIVKQNARSPKTGRRMAVYSFGDASMIQQGRIGGRSALPKKFKKALIERYGSRDCITGAELDERVLQIDHRIPYRIAGDAGLNDQDVEAYMLLDASSQRAKSWSCERCPNLTGARDPAACARCLWASPDDYEHIAMRMIRRVELVWLEDQVSDYERLRAEAIARGETVAHYLKRILRER